jgi:endonuclease-3
MGKPETMAEKKSRAQKIVRRLQRAYPHATCALRWKNPLQLLVATILSAQATDVKVNEVTPGLFKKYRTAADFANASPEELQTEIHALGFFRQKTKFIRGACQAIIERFNGVVPRTMEELTSLPGVARKTANVVLGTAFGVAAGIVVDTHVYRISRRLGLARFSEKSTDKVEQSLMEVIPQKDWITFGHALVLHGRAICVAQKPRCPRCPLEPVCPQLGVKARGE